MRVPEICFQFAAFKDVAGGLILLTVRSGSNSDTATSVFVDILTVPADKIFILSAMNVNAVGGGAQEIDALRCQFAPEPGAARFTFHGQEGISDGPDARGSRAENFSGEIWIPPGAVVRGTAAFSAGVSSNTVAAACYGFLIPRSNIQQG